MTKFGVTVGWSEVPHLSPQMIAEETARIPPYLIKAKSEGIPSLGAGAIYPVDLQDIVCDPFVIPDWMAQAYALDVGWNRTAALWGAHDKDSDILYLYSEYYRGEGEPPVHAAAIRARGTWIPGVIDPASRGRSQIDGRRLIDAYRELGVEGLTEADHSIEAGIYEVWIRLATGRLKIFRTLQNFIQEIRFYQRDEKGRIKDGQPDHLMDCYDAETQVLTETGWEYFAALSGRERLATVNLGTDEIEYQVPTDLIAHPYVGQMVRIVGHKLDALVTPNHRMIVYPRGLDVPEVRLARDLKVWDRLKLRGVWRGEARNAMDVCGAYGQPSTIDPMVWAEFLGWYVAEGCVSKNVQMPGRGYQVLISQNEGTDRWKYLVDLLAQTPWKWNYRGKSFCASSKWLWQQLRPLGDKYGKRVPEWVRQSEPAVINAFIDGAVAGDGWLQAGRRSYATVSQQLADDMQELFIKVGRNASVRVGRRGLAVANVMGRDCETQDQHWVSEWITPHGLLRDKDNVPNFGYVQYAGHVYCASVPNGTLIVRRNGKAMVAGNCTRYLVLSGLQVAIPRPASLWTPRAGQSHHESDYDPYAAARGPTPR